MERAQLLSTANSVIGATTLITLYLPAKYDVWLARDHINTEMKTTTNIKNKNVGKSVFRALKRVSHELKSIVIVPTNGMIICAGEHDAINQSCIETNQCI